MYGLLVSYNMCQAGDISEIMQEDVKDAVEIVAAEPFVKDFV